jgi:pilus assembly protein CpaE
MTQQATLPTLVLIGAHGEANEIMNEVHGLANAVAIEPDAALGLLAARTHEPHIVLLYLDHDPEEILRLCKQLASQTSSAPIVVSTSKSPDTILRAMRAGARDFAFLEQKAGDVARAIRELTLAQASVPPPAQGKVIALFGCKGGSGATTIALNLAGALMNADPDQPAKVVVVDADLEMGDVLVFLDMSSRYTFHDVFTNMRRLDSELLYNSLGLHKSGLYVLSQTDQVEGAKELTVEEFGKVIAFLREHFDFVVVDGLRDFRDQSLVVLDRADFILCTMTQDIPALKNANRCLQIFKRLRYPDSKIRLVVNRYRNAGGLTSTSISDALAHGVDATIANDFPVVVKAVNEGHLLVETDPNSKVWKDIASLASLVHDVPKIKKKGLFSRWGRG